MSEPIIRKKTLFERFSEKDVGKNVEKKNGLSYLSWVYALREIKKVDENATITIHEFPYLVGTQIIEGFTVPYLKTSEGVMVKTSVTIHGKTETEWLPVMDNRNATMANPKMTDINKSHKRCFAKAAAHHGLGLYIYAGEDLPGKPDPASQDLLNELGHAARTLAKARGVEPAEIYKQYAMVAGMEYADAIWAIDLIAEELAHITPVVEPEPEVTPELETVSGPEETEESA